MYSFEDNADYVYDVMWSPVHPAAFATVDGMGRLDLWNLNNYTEVRRIALYFLVFPSAILKEYLKMKFLSFTILNLKKIFWKIRKTVSTH